MSEAIGQVVSSRFEVLAQIGKGGHSSIFRARDRNTGDDVAIKMLLSSAAGDPEFAVRLVREHQAMVALAGTAAVRPFGLGSAADGAMCLIMELLTGVDFDDYLERIENDGGRIGVARLLEILEPVVSTLQKAHELGIVHRDLKPGNLYVLDGGGVRLLDFGLAKVKSAAPLTKDGMIIGSPSYIAPEVWAGKPAELDNRVDLYSLGAIVFRALAGRVPFEADSIPEKLKLATTAERPSLHELRPDLPPQIDAWVQQALAIEPDARFHRVRAMWNALRDALGLEPTPPSEPEQRTRAGTLRIK